MNTALCDYLQHLRVKAACATYHYERFRLLRFFRWLKLHKKRWKSLKRRDVEAFLLTINGNSYTRYKAWKALRDFYSFHKQQNDPTQSITFQACNRPLIKVPSQAVVAQKIAGIHGLKTETTQRNRLMAELAYGSGLRRRELALLDTDDLDLERGTVFVHGKGGSRRIVPLTCKAVEIARAYLERRGACAGRPLFVALTDPHRRRRLSLVRISMEFKRTTGLNTHAFRHAFATHILQNGCSIRIIQELLGHVNLTTTQYYTYINKDELTAVINRVHPRAMHKSLL